jgi:hypothetical protein
LEGCHGVWRSLVARVVRDDEAAGSNPVTPTNSRMCHPSDEETRSKTLVEESSANARGLFALQETSSSNECVILRGQISSEPGNEAIPPPPFPTASMDILARVSPRQSDARRRLPVVRSSCMTITPGERILMPATAAATPASSPRTRTSCRWTPVTGSHAGLRAAGARIPRSSE